MTDDPKTPERLGDRFILEDAQGLKVDHSADEGDEFDMDLEYDDENDDKKDAA